MENDQKYFVARWTGTPHECDDRTHYGPFTFAQAMHCMKEWQGTGDALALCDTERNIIPEAEWPHDELDSYAHHALIELKRGRANKPD